ncbi:glycosyl hydrolase 108 family protein [Herbaspirillum sp. RTI4]|uniref:glycoside hydrolase family 108 protein n=1 Tax=Herbaspirillum sp. RTI4 TaxID=3048640 RepID=UPI002AB5A5A2|nr:glycosyl hydrolase 108 family protein [Herbaspirillum sp. RTI4]MDY7579345.1 glycosyl hydrolase 108 family protein [Herbaspirillum sp. RTI4]MEA9980259.1 glycosyl hydrolase 108 family protein [Herbaspirillum sp. RTI4]
MTSFDDAFSRLIGNEGGYVNNPADPGGETMYGVTLRVARAFGYAGAMRDLPIETAKAIAKKQYWDPLRLDEFDPRVAFQIFDANYNGGHPVIWMQGAAGVKADGLLGAVTIAAVAATDPLKFIMRWNSLRIRYFTSLETWPTFGKGWSNRIADNLKIGAE